MIFVNFNEKCCDAFYFDNDNKIDKFQEAIIFYHENKEKEK